MTSYPCSSRYAIVADTDGCSMDVVITCFPLRLFASATPIIARLLDSVPPDVKQISFSCTFNVFAIFFLHRSYNFHAIIAFVVHGRWISIILVVILPPAVPLPHNILSLPNYQYASIFPLLIYPIRISAWKVLPFLLFLCAKYVCQERSDACLYPAAQSLPGKIRPPDRS